MEVEFDDPKLQRVAEQSNKLDRAFGTIGAKRIRSRLAELRAVGNVTELKPLPGKWHALDADRSGQWAGDAGHPRRIIIRPTPPVPKRTDGGIDWASVRSVTVVEIVDYH